MKVCFDFDIKCVGFLVIISHYSLHQKSLPVSRDENCVVERINVRFFKIKYIAVPKCGSIAHAIGVCSQKPKPEATINSLAPIYLTPQ